MNRRDFSDGNITSLTLQGSWIHKATRSQDHARIHLVRLQVVRLCPNHRCFGPISILLGFSPDLVISQIGLLRNVRWWQMVYPITCQVFFESECPFPNSFQGQLLRWFCVTNHLACHVITSQLQSAKEKILVSIFPRGNFLIVQHFYTKQVLDLLW